MTEYNGMKIGDIITTYNKGFFKLISIEPRFYTENYINSYHKNELNPPKVGDEYSPLFNYKKINPETGKINNSIGQCDSSYCKPFRAILESEIEKLQKQLELLNSL